MKVADSDNAIILDQVENGVAIRMAIIFLLGSQIKNICLMIDINEQGIGYTDFEKNF